MNEMENKPSEGARSRRLAAIMLTDIVGYSRRMSDNETEALKMLESHNGMLFPVIAAHEGRILKTMGDAVLAEFQSVVQAVKCSLAIQSALRDHNAPLPPGGRIEVRIGIHVGDVVVADGDLFGDGVNIAARIQPLAEPGGVCVSSVVHSQIKNMPEFMSVSMGKKRLKNIPEAVEVLRILPASETAAAWRYRLSRPVMFIALAAVLGVIAWSFPGVRGFFLPAPAARQSLDYLWRSPGSIITEAAGRAAAAEAMADEGNTAGAVAEIERAVELLPELPETVWEPGDIKSARPLMEKCDAYLAGLRGDPGAMRVRGKLLFRLGRGDEAFSLLEDACSIGDRASCEFVRERTVMPGGQAGR